MKTRVRWNLERMGSEDEEFIAEIEQEWIRLDINLPPSQQTHIAKLLAPNPTTSHLVYQYLAQTYDRWESKRQLQFVTADFSGKAIRQRDVARQAKLGITQGKWQFTSGPGCTHRSLQGKRFDLSVGMPYKGTFVIPSETAACYCIWSPIIPGLR